MRAPLPALLLAPLVLSSCGTSTLIHDGNAVVAYGQLFDSQDTDRSVTSGGVTSSTDLGLDTSGIGIRYEQFVWDNTSFFLGVERREYDVETTPSESADATEIHGGGRFYLLEYQAFQPFLQGDFFYGDLDFDAPGQGSSDTYWGLGVGGGASYFFSQSAVIEASLEYETTLVHPETQRGAVSVKDELTGWTGWVGIGYLF